MPLGEAFQLQDDLLGSLGDEHITGKPVGDDLREGKPTALVAKAFERATSSQLKALEAIGRPDIDAQAIREIQRVLIDTGAVSQVEHDIIVLRDRAIKEIAVAGLARGATEDLTALAHFVTDRKY
jgi:geranylgeranyl diphosphate synthase, type I